MSVMSLTQAYGRIEKESKNNSKTRIETQLNICNCLNITELDEEIILPIEINQRTQ